MNSDKKSKTVLLDLDLDSGVVLSPLKFEPLSIS